MQSIIYHWNSLSVRVRLILVFIAIKVVPLVLLVWIAWNQTLEIAGYLGRKFDELVLTANQAIRRVGDQAVDDSVKALDARARDEIERLTTDTAQRVAAFLYGRDSDILYVASLPATETAYRNFIERERSDLIVHEIWRLNTEMTDWEPDSVPPPDEYVAVPGSRDNETSFHYRPPVKLKSVNLPLYLEMTFVGLDGMEKVKVTASPRVSAELKDVSKRQNTYARAETYFPALKELKPGEIYVSDVVGTYVGSRIIGKFTPEAAKKRGIPFEPEKHAYAGKENPVGKRFRGIVRWATPVTENGEIVGWVTLALNHDHLMSFTDHIVPTDERYRDINDAWDGNYAFIWDHKGRSIVHPRHHSIVGYDENGEPAIPWLEDEVYAAFLESGKSWREFMEIAPTFVDQLQSRKPAQELTERGDVGLDCRWLNFAPQCVGWYNLADQGGSGSFQILWSGLYKLTTTAAIPYYTGQYDPKVTGNKRGFGIVTIGANVGDFHRAATESKERLNVIIDTANENMVAHGTTADTALRDNMRATAVRLTESTMVLVILVVIIAIWMASYLSRKLAWLNDGFNRFRIGEKDFRFSFDHKDEITSLASTFNEMADTLNASMTELQESNRRLQKALSDLQSATDQMIQSEKLAALGSLVAGIAHEVNTPLGISVTAASHLEELTKALTTGFAEGTMKKSDLTNFIAANRETVQIILGNLTRAANIIQSFKKIAVDQSSETWQTVGLKNYLKDIVVSLTPKLKKTKIEVSIQCPESLRINTMPGALSQILTNLVTNSLAHGFDAEQEGEITIAAKSEKQATVLTYTDNGKGIPRDSIGRIFEPFFTTARGRGGSGLGLHLVYNIVTRNLGGDITVSSVPGEGVTFILTLPAPGRAEG
ncbi:MAG: HAMP domain-containing histidine kinase [Candidatus Accumulibacter sp.]|jgi:signal transduction histidine kinase|nr:HAMP domain-containing histidine kinase [Accumulibacter sp.]